MSSAASAIDPATGNWYFGGAGGKDGNTLRTSVLYVLALGAPICRGDCNCDGVVDFGDINPFVAVLGGATPCSFENCDVNGDGVINFGDINPFVAILSGGGGPCP